MQIASRKLTTSLLGLAAAVAVSTPAGAVPPTVGTAPQFAAPVALTAPGNGGGSTLGDFNGDRRVDIAVARADRDAVTTWLGTGAGAYERGAPEIAVGDVPSDIVNGDFDGDGRDDVAVANTNDGTVSILAGTATGLVPRRTVVVGDDPLELASGDVDADGDADLVSVNSVFVAPVAEPAKLLRNDGGGRFDVTPISTGCPDPVAAAIGEFAGARIALLCVDDGSVRFVGAAGVHESCPGSDAFALTAADFDRDGALDLLVGCGDPTVALLTAADGFAPRPRVNLVGDSFSQSLSAGDFNGDGAGDFVAATPAAQVGQRERALVVHGDGTGSFLPAAGNRIGVRHAAGDEVHHVVAGDLNDDGRPDILTTTYGAVNLLLNTTPTPGVNTGAAAGLGPDSAVITGTVNPTGSAATFAVEYGTTRAYGLRTPALPSGASLSGSANQDVSATLSGLAPETTYHYRVVATNGYGTTYGIDRTFRTTAAPVAGPPPATAVVAPQTTRAPTVSGSPLTGRALTCAPGAWSGTPALAVSWLRNGAPIASGTRYTVKRADAGRALQCRVAATNAGGTTIATSVPVVARLAPCVVPRLGRLTPARARTALAGAGCRPGKVKRAFSSVRRGRVIRSTVAAGRRLAPDARVGLVVSRGPRR